MAKQKRRGHNEGSVYYAAYRDRWVAEVTTSLGKRKRHYCKTEREAIRKKNELMRELEQGCAGYLGHPFRKLTCVA